MIIKNAEDGAYLELNFQPDAEFVSIAREFVTAFYHRILRDEDLISRIALATHELLENAVKYSTDGGTLLRIEIKHQGERSLLSIRTSNHADVTQAAVLKEAFEEIHNASDVVSFYQALIHRNAKRSTGSGLGLGRILAEAEMSMSCSIERDQVFILAETYIDRTQRKAP